MKTLISLCAVCVLTLCSFSVASAQYGILSLNNGIKLVIRTEVTPKDDSANSLGNIFTSNSGNVVQRIVTDRKNKIYYGYDLLVERQSDSGKIEVSINPLSKAPSDIQSEYYKQYKGFTNKKLPNYPDKLVVDDGDTITLDLLENPITKVKISDKIKVIYKSSGFGFNYTDDKPARDFTMDEVLLRMERPDIFINDKKYETRMSITGNVAWIYIHGKGRFIFSFTPQPKHAFQKIGLIHDNKISFEFNGDKYKFLSRSSILSSGGKWNLWVMHDPVYKPVHSFTEKDPFMFGAAGKVDYIFEKR